MRIFLFVLNGGIQVRNLVPKDVYTKEQEHILEETLQRMMDAMNKMSNLIKVGQIYCRLCCSLGRRCRQDALLKAKILVR